MDAVRIYGSPEGENGDVAPGLSSDQLTVAAAVFVRPSGRLVRNKQWRRYPDGLRPPPLSESIHTTRQCLYLEESGDRRSASIRLAAAERASRYLLSAMIGSPASAAIRFRKRQRASPLAYKKFERTGSSYVEQPIQGRTYSLLWSRAVKKAKSENNSDSDAQLVERLKRKDEHALLELYDRHRRSVYRFVMQMTGSISIAEELTQEVFMAILDAMCSGKVKQFDPGKGTLEGYLLGIARNLVRGERRRARRLLSLESVVETSEWNRNFERLCRENYVWDAATTLAVRSELRILYRSILELPEHYRAVVVLCCLQQKSYQEAAAVLQCSEGTIASRMNRAKALLAVKLRRSATDKAVASIH